MKRLKVPIDRRHVQHGLALEHTMGAISDSASLVGEDDDARQGAARQIREAQSAGLNRFDGNWYGESADAAIEEEPFILAINTDRSGIRLAPL